MCILARRAYFSRRTAGTFLTWQAGLLELLMGPADSMRRRLGGRDCISEMLADMRAGAGAETARGGGAAAPTCQAAGLSVEQQVGTFLIRQVDLLVEIAADLLSRRAGLTYDGGHSSQRWWTCWWSRRRTTFLIWQVDLLVEQATDPALLSHMWPGWKPWL